MGMRTVFHTIVGLGLFALILFPAQPRAQDEPSGQAKFDSLLVEIVLNEEGVWALDSSGYEWHYDFALERFLPGPIEATDVERVRGLADDILIDSDGFPKRTVEVDPIRQLDRGSVSIAENEWVDGDVIAWERVTIKGWIKGDVISLRNRVLITQTGQVDGDVKAPRVIVREGGQVNGRIIEEAFEFGDISAPISKEGVVVAVVFTSVMLLGTLILVPLLPKKVKVVHDCAMNFKGRCFAIGFLLLPGISLIVILLLITIVGILLIPLVPILYLVAVLLGFIAYGSVIGRAILLRVAGGTRSYLIHALLGELLLMSTWLTCSSLMSTNGVVANGFGIFFLVMSILISVFVGCSGIGAAFLTRFGFRPYDPHATYVAGSAPAPAPPPIPEPPPFNPAPEPVPPKSDATLPEPPRKSEQYRPNPDQE